MNGAANAGRANDLLARLDQARRDGVDISCDTYPYTAGSTFVQSLLPSWAVDGGPDAILRRLREPDTRTRILDFLNAADLDGMRYNLVGAASSTNAPYEGQTFQFIADRRGLSLGELVCSVLEEEELRACYVHHAAHEGNVRDILQWPGQMIGSDGLHLPGKTHPRLYGTFPRVLGHYVRDERVISLETAVHKMTGAPAARIGLQGRGTLAARKSRPTWWCSTRKAFTTPPPSTIPCATRPAYRTCSSTASPPSGTTCQRVRSQARCCAAFKIFITTMPNYKK